MLAAPQQAGRMQALAVRPGPQTQPPAVLRAHLWMPAATPPPRLAQPAWRGPPACACAWARSARQQTRGPAAAAPHGPGAARYPPVAGLLLRWLLRWPPHQRHWQRWPHRPQKPGLRRLWQQQQQQQQQWEQWEQWEQQQWRRWPRQRCRQRRWPVAPRQPASAPAVLTAHPATKPRQRSPATAAAAGRPGPHAAGSTAAAPARRGRCRGPPANAGGAGPLPAWRCATGDRLGAQAQRSRLAGGRSRRHHAAPAARAHRQAA